METPRIRALLDYSRMLELEFDKARSQELWIIASVAGLALVECFLLMRALSSIDTIRGKPKYKDITVDQLCSHKWGVQKLGRLARDLAWLDVKFFPIEIREAIISSVRKYLPDQQVLKEPAFVPTLILFMVKEQRNFIHPGKVVMANKEIELTLEQAEGCAILADWILRCLRETQNDAAFF